MSTNEDTTIRFSGLKPGRYTYHFVLGKEFFESFDNEEICGGRVEIAAQMERKERLLMFTFSLRGEITSYCDRCLGELTLPIDGVEHLCVRFSDEEQCDDEDVVIMPENAYEIDLRQWLYEYVAVRVPLQHMHEDGACDQDTLRYLSQADAESNEATPTVDPRWAALQEILDHTDEKQEEK